MLLAPLWLGTVDTSKMDTHWGGGVWAHHGRDRESQYRAEYYGYHEWLTRVIDPRQRMNTKMGSEYEAADKESFYGEHKSNESLE